MFVVVVVVNKVAYVSDLGVHIDGYMALTAHTIVVGASPENKVKGRQADVILAAHYASELALRLVKPGNENTAVTEAVSKAAECFNCKAISGMLSHELKQNQADSGKTIIQNPTDAQKKEHEKAEFAVHEVYEIDVLITTGDGKVIYSFYHHYLLNELLLFRLAISTRRLPSSARRTRCTS